MKIRLEKDVDEWLKFIDQYKMPRNDLERSRAHYLSINILESKWKQLVNNLLAIPALIISFVFCCFISMFGLREKKEVEAIGLIDLSSKVANLDTLDLPDEIIKRYHSFQKIYDNKRVHLISRGVDFSVLVYWKEIVKKYPFCPYMLLLLWVHLVKINKIICMYNPKAIISTESENDFTSSIISEFCERNNIKNICIMHGEYLITPKHAFVRFSEFFVWDNFYVTQFERIRCIKQQFKVYEPKRFKLNIIKNEIYFLTYYLQSENRNELIQLKNVLRVFYENGYRCNLRPHPRLTDKIVLNDIFRNTNVDIENEKEIPLNESVGKCKYIVSKYSTVLTEAYQNNLNAVIDDYTDRNIYSYLKKTLYINLEKIDGRLSYLINLASKKEECDI